jgi:hypothetical protein
MRKLRRRRSPKKTAEQGFAPMLSLDDREDMDDVEDMEEIEVHGKRHSYGNYKGKRDSILKKMFSRKSFATRISKGDEDFTKSPADSSLTHSSKSSTLSSNACLQSLGARLEDSLKISERSDGSGNGGIQNHHRMSTLQAPSISNLGALLGESDSVSSDDEMAEPSSRRSTIRTAIIESLDDSTHPLQSLAPPSAAGLGASGFESSLSTVDDWTNQLASESYMRKSREINEFVNSNSDSVTYTQFSPTRPTAPVKKEARILNFLDSPNPDTGLGKASPSLSNLEHLEDRNNSSAEIEEASTTSRRSTIRLGIQASLDQSTHSIPAMTPPTMQDLGNYHGNQSDISDESTSAMPAMVPPNMGDLGQFMNSTTGSIDLEAKESSTKKKSTKKQSSESTKSRNHRKSRSPGPDKKGRNTASKTEGEDRPTRKKKASRSPTGNRGSAHSRASPSNKPLRTRSSKSPNRITVKSSQSGHASPTTPKLERPNQVARSLSSPTRAPASRVDSPSRRTRMRRLNQLATAEASKEEIAEKSPSFSRKKRSEPLTEVSATPETTLGRQKIQERRRSTGTGYFEERTKSSERSQRTTQASSRSPAGSRSPSLRTRKAVRRNKSARTGKRDSLETSKMIAYNLGLPPPPGSSHKNRTVADTPSSIHSRKGRNGLSAPSSVNTRKTRKKPSRSPVRSIAIDTIVGKPKATPKSREKPRSYGSIRRLIKRAGRSTGPCAKSRDRIKSHSPKRTSDLSEMSRQPMLSSPQFSVKTKTSRINPHSPRRTHGKIPVVVD